MKKQKKYGNILPCVFGMHHFSDLGSETRGQYKFVHQECDDCHRERTVSLWQVQYEGAPIQRFAGAKQHRVAAKPHTHAHA